MRKLRARIIGEEFMAFGCILVIMVYMSELVGMFLSPNIYFSDIYSSTIIAILAGVILFLTIENHNIHLRLLNETEEKVKN